MAKNKYLKQSYNLSVSSIRQLQEDLKKYRDSLNDKCAIFVQRLAEVGIPVIDDNMEKAAFTVDSEGIQSGADPRHYTYVKVNSFGSYARAELICQNNQIAFIEFGAGVYHNTPVGTSPHPKGGEFGYVIGSYGQGHGNQKIWGYYDESGALILTHGVEATMPMYKASLEMIQRVVEIARKVFE